MAVLVVMVCVSWDSARETLSAHGLVLSPSAQMDPHDSLLFRVSRASSLEWLQWYHWGSGWGSPVRDRSPWDVSCDSDGLQRPFRSVFPLSRRRSQAWEVLRSHEQVDIKLILACDNLKVMGMSDLSQSQGQHLGGL